MSDGETLTIDVNDERLEFTFNTLQGVTTFLVPKEGAEVLLEQALYKLRHPPAPKPKPHQVIRAILRGRF